VSGGGLFLELPYIEPATVEELLKGEKQLSLEIKIPNSAEPIKALAKVAWMEGRKEGDRYLYGAGVSFIRIDENDRDEIINYIIDLYLQEKSSR
jgi:c-di-GMP-binding flagellar brake protein YcgR